MTQRFSHIIRDRKTHGTEAIFVQKSHQEAEADKNHDVNVLVLRIKTVNLILGFQSACGHARCELLVGAIIVRTNPRPRELTRQDFLAGMCSEFWIRVGMLRRSHTGVCVVKPGQERRTPRKQNRGSPSLFAK